MENKYDSKVEARSVFTVFGQKKVINTEPLYQRGEVWPYKNKRLFIDSLIKGIIPNNIIVNKITDQDGIQNNCIDGKQRLTSIFEFMKNKYPVVIGNDLVFYSKIDKDYDRTKLEVCNRKKEFRKMTENEKSEFGDTSLSFAVYKNLTYSDEAEIFERIQHGMTLQSGEKVTSKIRDEESVKIFSDICNTRKEQLKTVFITDKDRDKHKDFISKIMFMVINESYLAPSSSQKDAFLEDLSDRDIKKTKEKIYELFDFFFNNRLYNNTNIRSDRERNNIDHNYLLTVIYWTYDKFRKRYLKIISDDDKCNILLNLFKIAHETANLKKMKPYNKKKCEKFKNILDTKYDELRNMKNITDIVNKICDKHIDYEDEDEDEDGESYDSD